MAKTQHLMYVFGEFTLDPSHRTFSSNGEPIHLPAKEFDTLVYFVENRGRTLTKDEMMSAIWDDTFVEESNLAQYVSRLRKILDTHGQKYIQTLPKKGYCFDADVSVSGVAGLRAGGRYGRAFVTVAVVSILLAGALIFAYVSKNRTASAKVPSGEMPTPLTDGKQDDGAIEWTSDNHIRFFRRESPTRVEAWIMNLDGSEQHREETPIKKFLAGKFSPDGRLVFFMKEGDPASTYLANTDGSNEIKLPLLVGNSDWSPDSTMIVYESKIDNNAEIFLYTVTTGQNVNLTNNPAFDADCSFSPDGRRIAFISSRDGNPEIYTMDLTGGDIRRLTNHPAWDSFPSISPDGTQMAFRSNRRDETNHLYVRDLNDESEPIMVSTLAGVEGVNPKCWSPDGTRLVVTSSVNGNDQIYVLDIEPYHPSLLISDNGADLQFPRTSPDGKRLIYQARLIDRSIELRLADVGSKTTKVIYKTKPDLPPTYSLSPGWSPDSRRIVFNDFIDGNSDVFSISAEGGKPKRLTDDPGADTSPVYSADGSEIYFTRDSYGQIKLFRMNADGTEQRRVTGKEGYEALPAVSPDGKILLFSADRQDRPLKGLDLFEIDPLKPAEELVIVSRPLHDVEGVFSPDGRRIAFVGEGDGNQEIYVMNSDGSAILRLTRNKAFDTTPSFTADSKSVLFSSNRDGKYAIYEIDLPL